MSTEDQIEEPQPAGTQILWGRVLVLLLALALAFWLGTTFGGDDAVQRKLVEQRDENARLQAQITAMEAELAAKDAAGSTDDPIAAEGADEPPLAEPSETAQNTATNDEKPAKKTATDNGGAYVIQSGDSLAKIALQVYGDPTQWRGIARANDLDEPYALVVGETLRIPKAE